MIALPLGLDIYHEEIADAISWALRANIICLAAPGNAGANKRAAFPARMPGVIAVFSTDSYGNPSLFNPSPIEGQSNFSTLGEDIPSMWNGRSVYKSGTTYSVCVAAGILATMFVFARDYLALKPRDWKTLHTPAGAEKFLELMSSSRGGYKYVAPWLLFSDQSLTDEHDGSESGFKNVIKGEIVAALR